MVNRWNESDTLTCTSGGVWTNGEAYERPRGFDLMGVQVVASCANWGSNTLLIKVQGTNEGNPETPPTDSNNWIDIDSIQFSANGSQVMGGQDRLVATQGFRYFRVAGAVGSGNPGATATFTVYQNADFND